MRRQRSALSAAASWPSAPSTPSFIDPSAPRLNPARDRHMHPVGHRCSALRAVRRLGRPCVDAHACGTAPATTRAGAMGCAASGSASGNRNTSQVEHGITLASTSTPLVSIGQCLHYLHFTFTMGSSWDPAGQC